jgi:hypothetical protein
LISLLVPRPGSTINSALGLSFAHCWRRETLQRLDAVAGAVAHFQRAMMWTSTRRTPRTNTRVAAGSAGARSIGYGLWLMRLQPFENGLQRMGLGR